MTATKWTARFLFILAAGALAACGGAHQANPLPGYASDSGTRGTTRSSTSTNATPASMCSIYSGFGALSFCYDFDETSGATLLDASGAGHNGTIAASGVAYGAAGLTSNSSGAETTNGSTGSMTSGFAPGSGSFSVSFFVDLKANANNYARLAATGDPKNSSNHSGWYITLNSGSTNPIYANMGSGSAATSFGYLPLALNTPANVTLTYNASTNVGTLCVATNATPTCASQTLPAAHVPSGNPIVFGGPPSYYPANATFDEAAYYAGTVLTSAQIATIASYAGSGSSGAPTPTAAPTTSATPSGIGMCSTYGGFGATSFCYDFDEASGTTLLDASGAGHNGTISSSGITYGAAGLTSTSSRAETTDGSTGSMTSGYVPTSGSFSFSYYVDLRANANNYARLAATGDPKNSSNHSGWYLAVNAVSTNPIFANIGTGSGSGTGFGYIPLALNTPANVTLTYSAASNVATLCVATNSSPTCVSQTLPAAYVPSGNAIVFGGAPKYYPANATFDEAAYYQGTVLSSSQIATLGGYVGSGSGATPAPVPSPSTTPVSGPTSAPLPSPTPTTTPTPAPSMSSTFNNFVTYGYDSARDMYNPNSAAFTPKNIAGSGLHLAWQVNLGGGNQSQPLVVTNVAGHAALLIVVEGNKILAYDGVTGTKVWGPTTLGSQNLQNCGTGGIAGTPIYDASLGELIVAAGSGGNNPNHVELSQIGVSSGSIIKTVDVTPNLLTNEQVSAHDGMLFNDGKIYIGTGSNCESASWRGRVLEVDPSSLAVDGTFFTTYGQGGNYGGGGIWAWGGVSGDAAGNIYVASGNAETPHSTLSGTPAPPFIGTTNEQAGYAEHLAKVSSDLTTVLDSNYPGFNFNEGYADLDFTGTPVLFQPNGCNQLSGTQGKGGTLVIHDTTNLSTPTSYMLSESSGLADYIGNPGYSPNTQLLYAAVSSSQGGSLEPPGMVALQFSCPGGSSSILWHTAFGPDSFGYSGTTPRSAPAATAGGVVFMGTPCTPSGSTCGTPSGSPGGALWAIDASTGAVLGGGNPILTTPDHIRLAPTIDGEWLWLQDNSGNLYGMTVDPSVKSISARRANRVSPTARYPNL